MDGCVRNYFLGIICLLAFACGHESPLPVSETRELMGTVVSITVLENGARAEFAEAIEAAFAAMVAVDRAMSTYDPKSEISRLNAQGTVEAGAEFLAVTRQALAFHRVSDGAFDVTMKPLLDLQARSFKDRNGPPSATEVAAVLGLVDATKIAIEGARISLPPGAQMTLDGIAKGFAIDRAIEVLAARGVTHALVDAGGDVRVLGDKNGEPWNVALQDPRQPSRHLAVVALRERAVATSGDYRRYFDPEMKYHHILDPRTGASAEALISATVLAPTAMMADALATSVFVLGPVEGMALVESLADTEALLVTDDREILTSSGW